MVNLAKMPLIKVAQDLKLSLEDAQSYRNELLAEARGLEHLEINLLTLREQELREQLTETNTNGNVNDNFRDTDVTGTH